MQATATRGLVFSSRKRHTRFKCDWSSDVCPSDLRNEEYTHLAVAAAIASGRADCGLGIEAAAQALDLDFIPLYQERYDLIIPQIYYDSQLLKPLFDTLTERDFQNTVANLAGYNVDQMGKVIL